MVNILFQCPVALQGMCKPPPRPQKPSPFPGQRWQRKPWMGSCRDSGSSTGPISWMEVRNTNLLPSEKPFISFALWCEGILLPFLFGLEKTLSTCEGAIFPRAWTEQQSCLEELQGRLPPWVCSPPQVSHGTQYNLSKFHLGCRVQNVGFFKEWWHGSRTNQPKPDFHYYLFGYLLAYSICYHLFFDRMHLLSVVEGKRGKCLWEKLVISMTAFSVVFLYS